MRTRSSRAPSSGVVARAAGTGEGTEAGTGAGDRIGAGATTGEGARAAAAAITSPFNTWPRLPLPATEARLILSSTAILAAAGAGGIAVEGTGAGTALAAGAWAGAPTGAAGPPESWPSSAPIVTV